MPTHVTGTREEWLQARLDLLAAEKALTRQSDQLARLRQALPWVRVNKDYRFDTEGGNVSLADLFEGRSQLLIYHFMFGPDYAAGCPSCSSIADGFNGFAVHLANHDVMLWAVSRAPLVKLQAYRQRMGWTFPWASSESSDFNFDFNVSITEEQQRAGGVEYNYQRGTHAMDSELVPEPVKQFAATCGTDVPTSARPSGHEHVHPGGWYNLPRLLDLCARTGWILGVYQWLDRAPKGRNEGGIWWRRHDEYTPRTE